MTIDYRMSYQCSAMWLQYLGEDIQPEADALASDLLIWAANRWGPPPPDPRTQLPPDIAVATAGATRETADS